MRSETEVELFRSQMLEQYPSDAARAGYYTACYEACVPRLFWDVSADQIKYNTAAFRQVVMVYCKKMKVALARGYGLLLTGDNGAGKTIFISYIQTQALKRGRSVYYTTLTRLDADIKRGFRDPQADRRLRYMLEADIIAVDEVGKEGYKQDSWLNTQFEDILKSRYDNGEPVLLASNLSVEDIVKMYGPSVESMLEGKYTKVPLTAGDFRKTSRDRMKQELGFK